MLVVTVSAVVAGACGGDDDGDSTSRGGGETTASGTGDSGDSGDGSTPEVTLDFTSGDAAAGDLRTSGRMEGTWTWHEGDAVECAPPSITLRLDGTTDTYGYVQVDLEGHASFGSGQMPEGPLGGDGGELVISDDPPEGATTAGTMTLDGVTVSNTDGDVAMTLDGEFQFAC